jgi:hypothetical protein
LKTQTDSDWFAFDFIFDFIIYGFGIIVAIPTITYSIRQLRKKKSILNILPIIIIGLGLAWLLVYSRLIKNDNVFGRSIFRAYYDGDLNGLNFELNDNGAYKIDSYSTLGGTVYSGTYILKGDTIILDNEKPLGIDNDFMTNKLILKGDTLLFHLDKNGNYTTGYFSMRVIENNLISLKLTNDLIGNWKVVESNLLPFEHISFCKDLGINSIFNFNESGILKIYKDHETNRHCNEKQLFWTDSLKLIIFEYDVGFDYDIIKLDDDSLILRNYWYPDWIYNESTILDTMVEFKDEYKELNQTGIIIKLTKINGG